MSAATPAQALPVASSVQRVPLRVRWLKINRFLDIERGTELHFHDGLNVLLGRNGSGKTTLLGLLSMIVRDDFTPLRSREFDIEYALAVGGLELVARLRHSPSGLLNKSGEQLTAGTPRLVSAHVLTFRYLGVETLVEVVAQADDAGGRLDRRATRTLDDPLEVRRTDVYTRRVLFPRAELSQPDGQIVLDLTPHQHELALANGLATYSSAAYRLDESLDIFHELIVGGTSSAPFVELSRPRGEERFGAGMGLSTRGLKSWEMFFRLHEHFDGVSSSDPVHLDGWLPYLPRFAEQIGAARVECVLDRPSVRIDGDREILSYHAPTYFIHTRDGGVLRHDELSYGEKRLLAICHYIACNPDIVIMDEMVNGLHADWIEFCLREIGSRQAFLASQNPLLVDNVALASAENAQRTFILCERSDASQERAAGRRWRHMTDDEAGSFMDAYEVGIQHVSEILRVKGLW